MGRKKSLPPEADEVDDFVDTIMRSGKFDPVTDEYEKECNAIYDKMHTLSESDSNRDHVQALMMRDTLRTAVIRMIHHGRNPASTPYRHIRHALAHPTEAKVFARGDQQATIDGPLRAIRVKCSACQGHDQAAIRECSTINCMVWPFRMGSSPFYARLLADQDEEISDDEIAADEAAELEALNHGN